MIRTQSNVRSRVRDSLSERIDLPKRPQATCPPLDGLTYSLPLMSASRLTHLCSSHLCAPSFFSAPFAVASLPLQGTPNVRVSSMHQERLMMSAIQPSAAALEAGLMEQEQRYPCSVVLP